jgi:DNA-binding IclR family transcriptional regulator
VLKRSAGDTGVMLAYSDNEKMLLEYLEKTDRITIMEFCKLLKLTRRRAQRILVDLVLSGVVRIHTSEKEEYYTAV